MEKEQSAKVESLAEEVKQEEPQLVEDKAEEEKKSISYLSEEETRELEPRENVEISLKGLLQAGVHYGHQTSRWNPKMGPYIHSIRNGIHIINLPRTLQCWREAREAILKVTSSGGKVLFVGTKKQAQTPIVEEARRCGAFYVSRRWLGGMMTNLQTVRKSVERMKKLESTLEEEEKLISEGSAPKFKKKERLMMSRELSKLSFSLSGIRDLYKAPDLIFVVDIKKEDIAINEADRLDIPVVALVDTNCDPEKVAYPIPSNDDGSRAIRLFAAAVSDAVNEGKKLYVPKPVKKEESKTNRRNSKNGKPGGKKPFNKANSKKREEQKEPKKKEPEVQIKKETKKEETSN